MIKGIGVDIVEIDRIRKSLKEYGDKFLNKIFTLEEVKYCKTKRNMHQHLAARFAAKEAFSKAFATGWTGEFRWRDVEVLNDPSGKPNISLYGNLKRQLSRTRVFISLSHSDSSVVAVVVIEKMIKVDG